LKSVNKEKLQKKGDEFGKPVHLLALYCQFAILAERHTKNLWMEKKNVRRAFSGGKEAKYICI